MKKKIITSKIIINKKRKSWTALSHSITESLSLEFIKSTETIPVT